MQGRQKENDVPQIGRDIYGHFHRAREDRAAKFAGGCRWCGEHVVHTMFYGNPKRSDARKHSQVVAAMDGEGAALRLSLSSSRTAPTSQPLLGGLACSVSIK